MFRPSCLYRNRAFPALSRPDACRSAYRIGTTGTTLNFAVSHSRGKIRFFVAPLPTGSNCTIGVNDSTRTDDRIGANRPSCTIRPNVRTAPIGSNRTINPNVSTSVNDNAHLIRRCRIVGRTGTIGMTRIIGATHSTVLVLEQILAGQALTDINGCVADSRSHDGWRTKQRWANQRYRHRVGGCI